MQPTPDAAKDTVEAACKYRFYLERQEKEMDAWRRNQNLRIPMDIEYTRANFPSLSAEEIQKLAQHRPATFHAASQISGVTPHSLVYLFNYVTKAKRGKGAKEESGDRSAEVVTHHWQEIGEQETEKGVVAEEEAVVGERARKGQDAKAAAAGGS